MNKTVRNILLRLSMLVGLALFVTLMVLAKLNRDAVAVKDLNVEIDDQDGNMLVTRTMVEQVMEDKFDYRDRVLKGKNLERMEREIERIPQVMRADAYTDNKGTLTVKVTQRVPLFRVFDQVGETYYVDQNGVKFPVVPHFTARVPVVNGFLYEVFDGVDTIKSLECRRVARVIRFVQQNPLWKELAGHYYINENRQIELIPRFGKATVILGDDGQLYNKFKKLEIFYFDVLKKVGWDYYRVINIMYKDQVVCAK